MIRVVRSPRQSILDSVCQIVEVEVEQEERAERVLKEKLQVLSKNDKDQVLERTCQSDRQKDGDGETQIVTPIAPDGAQKIIFLNLE